MIRGLSCFVVTLKPLTTCWYQLMQWWLIINRRYTRRCLNEFRLVALSHDARSDCFLEVGVCAGEVFFKVDFNCEEV